MNIVITFERVRVIAMALALYSGVVNVVLPPAEISNLTQSLQGLVRLDVARKRELAHTDRPDVEVVHLLDSA